MTVGLNSGLVAGETDMTTNAKITDRFWEELQAKPMIMLGVVGDRDGHTQPMTAHFEGRLGPIWFFAGKDDDLYNLVGAGARAIMTYTAPGHDLYASVHGDLSQEESGKVVDRFWNNSVAAWYEKGKDDPNLALLRFEPDNAKIWLADASFGTTVKSLFKGPKAAAADMVAEVRL
jgi:general stress protein 26